MRPRQDRTTMTKKTLLKLFILLLASNTLFACTTVKTVKAWERGNLTKKGMAWQDSAMETTFLEHVYFSKEGSISGGSAAGGGCGCN